MKWLRVLASLLAFAAITGCSGSKATASGAQGASGSARASGGGSTASPIARAPLDPCKLLTQREASAAAGVQVRAGKPVPNLLDTTTCDFDTPANDQLTITEEPMDLYDSFAVTGGTSIRGIGEKAQWENIFGSVHLLIVEHGRMVEVIFPQKATSLSPAMTEAGKQIASRM